jgi:predicted transglutaminase-like cysteine proteinase
MQSTINKIAIVLSAVLLSAAPAEARFDFDGWKAPTTKAFAEEFEIALVRISTISTIEPAAGTRIEVASLKVELDAEQTAIPRRTDLGAFQSVAISAGKLPAARKWQGVTNRNYAALFSPDCAAANYRVCDTNLAQALRRTHDKANGLAQREVLDLVNQAVNRSLRYASDRAIWGKGDYWATPAEILGKGRGDCEDFATLKMWLLRSLGFDPSQLQLVVLQDTQKRVYHAVLVVHLNGQRYTLDNLTTNVSSDASFPSYLPIMSFVGDHNYIHGFKRKRSDLAELPDDLSAVSPGDGV